VSLKTEGRDHRNTTNSTLGTTGHNDSGERGTITALKGAEVEVAKRAKTPGLEANVSVGKKGDCSNLFLGYGCCQH